MKNMRLILLVFVVCAWSTHSCSNDNFDKDSIRAIGVVQGAVSCNTTGNGLAYRINIENYPDIEYIVTASLPEQYKQAGLQLSFDMKATNNGITTCTSEYSPNVFYELTNIQTLSNEN